MIQGNTLEEFCVEYFFDNVELWELNDFEFPNIEVAEKIAEHYSKENPDKQFFVCQQENCDWYTVDYYDKEECGYNNVKLIKKYF